VRATIFFKYGRHLSGRLFDGSNRVSDDEADRAVKAELSHYPTAEGWQPYRPQGLRLGRRSYTTVETEIAWVAEHAVDLEHDLEFASHVFQHRVRDQWWLRPGLNDAGDFLGPLMTWWALLYGLSMLARYYPAEWTSALRLDESPEAVPLGAALDEALLAVPQFVLGALVKDERPGLSLTGQIPDPAGLWDNIGGLGFASPG
jgi:hypothetical protein